MTCKLHVKHGNECRNWKASTLNRHAHFADHKQSVVAKAMTWSFSVSIVFNEKRKSHAAILCALNFKYRNVPMSRSFPYAIIYKVEGVNMNNMYKLLCIRSPDHY